MQIVHYPHPVLRYRSAAVHRVDANLRTIVAEMFELMYEDKGVGLAANQVNLPLRLFIVNPAGDREEGEELVFINPVISRPRGSCEREEGCLSLPGIYADVTRPASIHVQAYDLDGNEFDDDVDGFLARIIQHETDHLNGTMFFDRLPEAARLSVEPALQDSDIVFRQRRSEGGIPDDAQLQSDWAEWIARYGQPATDPIA